MKKIFLKLFNNIRYHTVAIFVSNESIQDKTGKIINFIFLYVAYNFMRTLIITLEDIDYSVNISR
jgi:hypothetical protein